MKTVKEYAAEVGKSHQAVYKQLKSKKNEERLSGHIWQQDGTTYLDDVAIEILNESRKLTSVQHDQVLKTENERMIKEIDQLKNKIISLQDEVKVKTEQMTQLLIENKEKTLLLDLKTDQATEIDRLKTENERLHEELTSRDKLESQTHQKKGFLARIFRKRGIL